MNALMFAVAILAVYRISRMVTLERGPFDLFTRMQHVGAAGGWVNDGLNCPLCVSFWVSMAAFVFLALGLWWVLLPFALSGAATLLHLRS